MSFTPTPPPTPPLSAEQLKVQALLLKLPTATEFELDQMVEDDMKRQREGKHFLIMAAVSEERFKREKDLTLVVRKKTDVELEQMYADVTKKNSEGSHTGSRILANVLQEEIFSRHPERRPPLPPPPPLSAEQLKVQALLLKLPTATEFELDQMVEDDMKRKREGKHPLIMAAVSEERFRREKDLTLVVRKKTDVELEQMYADVTKKNSEGSHTGSRILANVLQEEIFSRHPERRPPPPPRPPLSAEQLKAQALLLKLPTATDAELNQMAEDDVKRQREGKPPLILASLGIERMRRESLHASVSSGTSAPAADGAAPKKRPE